MFKSIQHLLTFSVVDSPAKTSALQDSKQASQSTLVQVSGSNTPESLAPVDLRLLSLKMSRAVESSGCPRCGEHCTCLDTIPLPSHYLPETLTHPTYVNESSWLPTPTAQNYGSNRGGAAGRKGKVRHSLASLASLGLLATPTATGNQLADCMQKHPGCVAFRFAHPIGPLHPNFLEWMMGFPTDWTETKP